MKNNKTNKRRPLDEFLVQYDGILIRRRTREDFTDKDPGWTSQIEDNPIRAESLGEEKSLSPFLLNSQLLKL